jgi:hypothetical protein
MPVVVIEEGQPEEDNIKKHFSAILKNLDFKKSL